MRLVPITPSPFSAGGGGFQARCSRCSCMATSVHLAADIDGPPFSYVCIAHWDSDAATQIAAAYGRAFVQLADDAKKVARSMFVGRRQPDHREYPVFANDNGDRAPDGRRLR